MRKNGIGSNQMQAKEGNAQNAKTNGERDGKRNERGDGKGDDDEGDDVMGRKGFGLKPISKIANATSSASNVPIKKLPVYRYVSKERIKERERQGWVRAKEGEVAQNIIIENDDSVLMKKV